MPQKLINNQGTISKKYLYEVTCKEEQLNVQMTLQILHSSYTYLRIPKDHAHMWVQGIYQLPLFSWGQLRYHLWK